jgi:hypothetical protein
MATANYYGNLWGLSQVGQSNAIYFAEEDKEGENSFFIRKV